MVSQHISKGGETKAHQMEMLIGLVLRAGLTVSMMLILTGYVWRWLATGHFSFDYTIDRTSFFEFLLNDIRQVATPGLRPRLLVNLGIGTLLITPYLRVLASLAYFAVVIRDLKYAMFTAFVLSVLTYYLLLG